MPDMSEMLAQVQQMQTEMAAAQEALAAETVEAEVGGGSVTVVVTGAGDVRSIRIDPSIVDPDDVEMLEDLVLAAVREGLREAQSLQQERLGAVGGFGDALGGLLG